jgi:hypothetical protein
MLGVLLLAVLGPPVSVTLAPSDVFGLGAPLLAELVPPLVPEPLVSVLSVLGPVVEPDSVGAVPALMVCSWLDAPGDGK